MSFSIYIQIIIVSSMDCQLLIIVMRWYYIKVILIEFIIIFLKVN